MSTKQKLAPVVDITEATRRRRTAVERTPLGSQRAQERLRTECLREKLRSLPGWKLVPGNRAVDRVRSFGDPLTAASYALYVLTGAAVRGQHVAIELRSNQLAVTLHGRMSGGRPLALTLDDLSFAQQLG